MLLAGCRVRGDRGEMTAWSIIMGLLLIPTAGNAQSLTDVSRRDSFQVGPSGGSDPAQSGSLNPCPSWSPTAVSGRESSITDPPIRTDQGGVTLRNAQSKYFYGTIAYRFTNRSETVVYIPVCQGPHPPFLQKWEDGNWVLGYSLAVPLCLDEPLEIAPGESIARVYEIIHGMPGSNLHRTFKVAEIDGVYRMIWNIYRHRNPLGGTSDLLPLELRVSNPFKIVIEPGW